MGIGSGEELLEEISGAGEMGQTGGREFDAATVAQDNGTVASRRERGGLPIDFKELRLARADLASIVIEGVDGDAEGGGVDGAGLAAVGEFLGENEEFLTGATGLFHPYKSAHGGGRWKAGVRRADTVNSRIGPLLQCGSLFADGQDQNSEPQFSENDGIADNASLVGAKPSQDLRLGGGFVGSLKTFASTKQFRACRWSQS